MLTEMQQSMPTGSAGRGSPGDEVAQAPSTLQATMIAAPFTQRPATLRGETGVARIRLQMVSV